MERSRAFCFTLNNFTPEEVEKVKAWDCKYLIFGKEVGASNTPHLQGYVSFENQKQLKALKKLSDRAHWEIARGTPKQASEYCEKDGDVFQKGTRPLSQVEKGALEKDRWATALKCVQEGKLEEMDPQILCQHLRQVEYAAAQILGKRKLSEVDGEFENQWMVGPPGCGKSRKARDENPGAYIKDPKERWWDGYAGEEVVIIDDFDKYQLQQGGDMKRWCDRYPFRAAVKGGYLMIRPRKIVVTSNYSIDDIWHEDALTVGAIARRFNVLDKWPPAITSAPGRVEPGAPPAAKCPAASDPLDSLSCLSPPDPAGAQRLAGGGESPGRLDFMVANGW